VDLTYGKTLLTVNKLLPINYVNFFPVYDASSQDWADGERIEKEMEDVNRMCQSGWTKTLNKEGVNATVSECGPWPGWECATELEYVEPRSAFSLMRSHLLHLQ
jgi:hypothetical protein